MNTPSGAELKGVEILEDSPSIRSTGRTSINDVSCGGEEERSE